jgi:periplasmic protein TonB
MSSGAPALPGAPFGPAIVGSLLAHIAAAALFIVVRPSSPPPLPPAYKVDLVAAPRGERRAGVIDASRPAPTAEGKPASAATPPAGAERVPEAKVAPILKPTSKATPKAATPSLDRSAPKAPKAGTQLPKAGGGAEGGAGTDVVTVRTEGIDFPYPGYLSNIVRQIALNFQPRPGSAGLRADVRFFIHRDGTVSDLVVRSSSGNYGFDLAARGAVEAAGSSRAFGALPTGYRDDVLTVYFSFDPRVLR